MVVTPAYAGRGEQTDWWELKKHWENCVTKEHNLDVEYMSRVTEYNYAVPHDAPIRKVAVLPPPITGRFAKKSLIFFEKDVLFNAEEMEKEYRMIKNWKTVTGNVDTYKAIRKAGLEEQYYAFLENFIDYRTIDKELFSGLAGTTQTDTFLLLLIGYDIPGALAVLTESEPWAEDRFYNLNIYLFSAQTGKIIWELGQELAEEEQYQATRWRGLYRAIYKVMPVE